jgi:hypothetical protein
MVKLEDKSYEKISGLLKESILKIGFLIAVCSLRLRNFVGLMINCMGIV